MKTEDEILAIKREIGSLMMKHELNLEEAERIYVAGVIEVLMERHHGNQSKAAAELIQSSHRHASHLRRATLTQTGEIQAGPQIVLPRTH